MQEFIDSLGGLGSLTSTMSWERALISLLLAFIIGQAAAWVYMFTHTGLSYSRAFVQSIVLLTMVVCMAMMITNSSIS